MKQVSDAFLLNMAEVSATLTGLFLVGVFFWVETGFRRWDRVRGRFEPYLRVGTRITLIAFAISLGLSLALVTLEIIWARTLFAGLSLILVAANVDSALRIHGVAKATGSTVLLVNEVVTTVLAVLLVDAVGSRRTASDQGRPHVGDPPLVRGRLPQHQRDCDVGVRHGQARRHHANGR
jgi:hypothetical protein